MHDMIYYSVIILQLQQMRLLAEWHIGKNSLADLSQDA